MSSIDNLYWVFLSTGFLIGLGNCIGMCGPIVVSLSLSLRERGSFLPHLLYNSGRITTYAVLGGIMGVTGCFTRVFSHITVIQKGVMVVAGLMAEAHEIEPIVRFAQRLKALGYSDADLARIDGEAADVINDALQFAQSSLAPEPDDAFTDLFA